MGRRPGSRNLGPERAGFEKEISVRLHLDEHTRYTSAAHRAGLTFAEFARRALDEYTLAMDRFFYVRMPNGQIHPPLHEVGYEFIENAKRFAARVNGSVIRATVEASPAENPRPPE